MYIDTNVQLAIATAKQVLNLPLPEPLEQHTNQHTNLF